MAGTVNIQIINYEVKVLCDFGCGNEANFKLKNGKNCCSKSFNSCAEIKKKNSEKLKEAHKNKPESYSGRNSWNKGLTKETDERVNRNSLSCSIAIQKLIKEGKWTKRSPGKDFCKELSESQSLHNRGGKCKWYEVSGQKVQGTWEKNLSLKLDELKIKWVKLKTNKDIIKYILKEKERSYTPDFFLPDLNIYLEIKGYWWGNDKEKMQSVISQHPELNIVILEKKHYEQFLVTGSIPSISKGPIV